MPRQGQYSLPIMSVLLDVRKRFFQIKSDPESHSSYFTCKHADYLSRERVVCYRYSSRGSSSSILWRDTFERFIHGLELDYYVVVVDINTE